MEIDVIDPFFAKFPRIYIVNRKEIPSYLLAHLEVGIGLCYADRGLLRLDPYDPGGSILLVLAEAERTIARSLGGRVRDEIAHEFPLYWSGDLILVRLSPTQNAQAGILRMSHGRGGLLAQLVDTATPKLPNSPFYTARIFAANRNLLPTKTQAAPQKLSDLEAWLSIQGLRCDYSNVLQILAAGEAAFFRGKNGWVGCRITLPPTLKTLAKKSRTGGRLLAAELAKRAPTIDLLKYTGGQADLTHVTSRNLGSPSSPLSGKRISVVGCGAVGSFLARFLVQNGAGNGQPLKLLDNDVLLPGNLGRHLLNFDDLGQPKANALARELKRFHPDVQVVPIQGDIVDTWPKVTRDDLVVDASGVETISDYLNARALDFRDKERAFNILHVWLFGNGVAAQTFLNAGQGLSCYRCLRPELDRPWIFDPRKRPNQQPKTQPATCGDGPYLPFAVNAPATAASMALAATLDFFSGAPGARLRTQVLNRSEAKHIDDRSPKRHERCPACGKRNKT